MIDIHCHILPGIDDGPKDLAAALDLARAYVADGVRTAVATPHIYPGVFDNSRASIKEAFDLFQAELISQGIPLHLQWGAEVRASGDVLDMLASDQLCFIGQEGTWRYMLLELPDGQIPVGTDKLVAHLLRANVKPVIVHPERNKAVMADVNKLLPLLNQGCLIQVTAGSLLGEFGSRAQATAECLIDNGWVTVVASDAHKAEHSRTPRMRDALKLIKAKWGESLAHQLTLSGPARITAPAASTIDTIHSIELKRDGSH